MYGHFQLRQITHPIHPALQSSERTLSQSRGRIRKCNTNAGMERHVVPPLQSQCGCGLDKPCESNLERLVARDERGQPRQALLPRTSNSNQQGVTSRGPDDPRDLETEQTQLRPHFPNLNIELEIPNGYAVRATCQEQLYRESCIFFHPAPRFFPLSLLQSQLSLCIFQQEYPDWACSRRFLALRLLGLASS